MGRLCLAVTLAAVCCVACDRDAKSGASRAAKELVYVETKPVEIADVEIVVEAVGTILPIRRVEVRSETEATVARVLVNDGQAVDAGTPLVELDKTKLSAEVRLREAGLTAARIRAANARTALTRARDLVERGFIPKQEFDDARAAAEGAAAEVAEAEASVALGRELLGEADIRAPIAGIAGECAVDPGDFLRKGDLLLTIVDSKPVEVEFTVPEEHLAGLRLGLPVSVSVPTYPGELFTGRLAYIEPEVLTATRSVRLKATVPNDDLRLHPGQFAKVRVVLAVHRRATLIPEEAIVPEGTSTWVYVVENGRAMRHKVTLGIRREGHIEITDGIAANDTVVVNGQLRLSDGAPVEAIAAQAAGG